MEKNNVIAIDACAHVNFLIKYGFSYSCDYMYKLYKDGRKFLNFFLKSFSGYRPTMYSLCKEL